MNRNYQFFYIEFKRANRFDLMSTLSVFISFFNLQISFYKMNTCAITLSPCTLAIVETEELDHQ